ncbi:MAG: ASKHA domain-containing protein [Anaerolineae bacterium]
MYRVTVLPSQVSVQVPAGTLLHDALAQAGVPVNLPCGGQGRCGRCLVLIRSGTVSRRLDQRLPRQQVAAGFVLACQTPVESDLLVEMPSQELVAHAIGEKAAAETVLPSDDGWRSEPWVAAYPLEINPPSLQDNTNDWDRVQRTLRAACGAADLQAGLPVLRSLGATLRAHDWQVDAVVEHAAWHQETYPPRLLGLAPYRTARLVGAAVDIGTTSNVVRLVDLADGRVLDTAATYNAQIACGEDVISRIIYSRREGGLRRLQELVIDTLNGLLSQVLQRQGLGPHHVVRLCAAGNPTMVHLFLGIDPQPIRLEPYIPAINHPQPVRAAELGLHIHPEAQVDCLPGVGAYVGADIVAGVLASGMHRDQELTLLIDIGTNGEIVLGNSDWLISCACSAGPAFEGAGVRSGMRAVPGAIDDVWLDPHTFEPRLRTVGGLPPQGICGSGMISLLAEMFVTGVADKGGRLNRDLHTPRIRLGEHGPEYLLAAADPAAGIGADVVLTEVDIANLLRAKGAIYAGFSVLARSVGLQLADVERVLVAGSFGRYISIEKAVLIGMLPDMPWDRFHYLGNSSLQGAYHCLLSRAARHEATQIAQRMTYLELSADNSFMDEFTSALFLPHTDEAAFPSVQRLLNARKPSLSHMGGPA